MSIFSLVFWRAAFERAIKSAAQGALVAGIGAAGFDAIDGDWRTFAGAALGMGLASLLTSVASDALTDGAGPSATNAETLNPPPAPDEGGLSDLGLILAVVVVVVLLIAFGVLR